MKRIFTCFFIFLFTCSMVLAAESGAELITSGESGEFILMIDKKNTEDEFSSGDIVDEKDKVTEAEKVEVEGEESIPDEMTEKEEIEIPTIVLLSLFGGLVFIAFLLLVMKI